MTTYETSIGRLEFTHDFIDGHPTDDTVERLHDLSFAQWEYENGNPPSADGVGGPQRLVSPGCRVLT